MTKVSFGDLHNRLDEILDELNDLRVELWNGYAEESRHPKPKVSVWIVYRADKYKLNRPTSVHSIHSSKIAASIAIDRAKIASDDADYYDWFVKEATVRD